MGRVSCRPNAIHRILFLLVGVQFLSSGCGGESGPGTLPLAPVLNISVVDSIQGGPEGGGCSFGAIERIGLLPDGSVLALDIARSCIFVFGPGDSLTAIIGESGPGPGEMSYPSDMAVLGDGTIAVSDAMKGSVLLYSGEGDYTGAVEGFPMTPVRDMHPFPEGGFVGWRTALETVEGRYTTSIRVCRWNGSGEPERVYWERSEPSDLSSFTAMMKQSLYAVRVTVDARGRVFVAPLSTSDYTILCFQPGGEQYGLITLDLPETPRTREEMETETVMMENRMRRMGDHGMPMVWEPDPLRTMVGEMGTDDLGNLWVRRGTESEPLFDVFDPDSLRILYSARLDYSGDCSGWLFSIEPRGMLAWSAGADSCQRIYRLRLSD